MATTYSGGLTEVGKANWQGYRATLLELAKAGGQAPGLAETRRRRAADVLFALDDLLTDEVLDGQRRVWRWVAHALVAAGEERLWAALYAASDLAAGPEYTPGDEARFLERPGLPPPTLPTDWSARWLPAPPDRRR
jgi:hypothetical protein